MRSYMYSWMVLANDEVSQKLGLVGIVYFHPSMSVSLCQSVLENRQVFEQFHASLPIRISALHFINGTGGGGLMNTAARMFRNAVLGTLHQVMRIRCRFHESGTFREHGWLEWTDDVP